MRLLEGKVAVVYGAAGHVGSAIAKALASDGAAVHCVGRRKQPLDDLIAEIGQAGGTATRAELDARDEPAVDADVARLVDRTGRVDVTINAIGPTVTCEEEVNPALEMTLDSFTKSLESRGLAQFITARAAARHMLAMGRGTVLFLSATPGQGIAPLLVGDAAGFSAVEGMARCLAREWGPAGVRVSCIRAGGMPDSPRIKDVQNRMAELMGAPKEMFDDMNLTSTLAHKLLTAGETADVVSFLASDRADSLTGTIVNASHGAFTH